MHAVGKTIDATKMANRTMRVVAKSFRFGEQNAIFVNHRMAVPCEIGCGFAGARSGVQVPGETAGGLIGDQIVTVLGLAYGNVRGGKIEDHASAGERGLARRRNRHPKVFANLDEKCEAGSLDRFEENLLAEWDIFLVQ